jgi:tellurite resistance protein TerC
MIWFWIGFFIFVAMLLVLDLAVLNRRAETHSFRHSLGLTMFWIGLGLSFTVLVYFMYEHEWLGAKMDGMPDNAKHPGIDAGVVYLSAYLLELALSVDNLFVMSLLFRSFRVPHKHQHRVLFWGILGAVVFRVLMLGGGAYLASKFTWIFYVFGGYLIWSGLKLFKPEGHEEEDPLENSTTVRILRRFVRIVDGDHDGKFMIRDRGRRALTTLAVCLIVVELSDVVFALDSIPAVLAISRETFIVITSNIFAILGLRSMYSVLAGAMQKFQYLKYALAVLLIVIGAKMITYELTGIHIPHVLSLGIIAGIITAGVVTSIIATRKTERESAIMTAQQDPSEPVQVPVPEAKPEPDPLP